MKKNITVNIFGSLYAIDEDAYELLNRYQNDMKRYFSHREDGGEIADDIEHRVAELLAELKAGGVEAITIEHVQDIIRRIGSPEEMETESGEEQPVNDSANESRRQKKLYRNPDDKMLSGLTSGLACYFDKDPLLFRLLMVILAFLTQGLAVIAYLIVWLIVPEAKTPEQRLEMQGKSVNMENLREEILNGTQNLKEKIASQEVQSKARGCLGGLLDLVAKMFKFLLILMAIGVLLFLFGMTVALVLGIGGGIYASTIGFGSLFWGNVDACLLQTLDNLPDSLTWEFWIAAVSLLVFVVVSVYTLVYVLGRMMGKMKQMNKGTKWTLVVVWFVSLILSILFTVTTSTGVSRLYREMRIEQNTHNGFYVPQDEWAKLQNYGWSIVYHKYCDDDYVSSNHFYNRKHRPYLHARNKNGIMEYQMEREQYVEPGVYELTAVGRCDGSGAFVYAVTRDSLYLKEIPVCGDEGGNIWEEAVRMTTDSLNASATAEKKEEPVVRRTLSEYKEIAKAHKGKGYGWSRIRIGEIEVKEAGKVRFGVSNVPSFTDSPWHGEWLSAAEFQLTKVK